MQPRGQGKFSLFQHMEDENMISSIFKRFANGEVEIVIDQTSQHLWAAFKITIGNLFVRGYRLFKHMVQQQCLIFIKREAYTTKYLYFKMVMKSEDELAGNFLHSFSRCMNEVNKMRKKQDQHYTLLILCGLDYSALELKACNQLNQVIRSQNKFNKKQLMTQVGEQNYDIQNFAIGFNSLDDIIIGESDVEQRKLKQILHSYIDTFGQKYKTNYYKDLTKKSLYLLNTLNTIIFQETNPNRKQGERSPCSYNQIQSACWTVFIRGALQSDRKDIVLTGSGSILFLDLIFLTSINLYADQYYEQQVEELIKQCQKTYCQARVKVIRIENILTERNVYNYQSKIVSDYSKKISST